MDDRHGVLLESVKFFDNNPIDPTTLAYILIVLSGLVFAVVYGSYRYQRFKKLKEFNDEMRQLELDPSEENTLTELVKRHALNEPVNVLLSKRLFDELAAEEIAHVLGSAGSAGAKANFVNILYEIRRKTYHPDWSNPAEAETAMQLASSPQSRETAKAGLREKTGQPLPQHTPQPV